MTRRYLAAILATALLLSGCWSSREIDQLTTVLSLGIDRTEEGQFIVTAILGSPVNPSTQRGGGSDTAASGSWILTASGRTVFEAVRNLSMVVPRRLYWPHAETIIISERLARHGIDEILDVFTRDHEPRRSMHMLVAEDSLVAVLGVTPILERSLSRSLDGLIFNRQMNGYTAGLDLNHYMREHTAGQTAPLLMVLTTEPEPKGGLGQSPAERLKLSRSAVFWQNRLVGYLDKEETRGALMMRDELKGGVISVPCPGEEERLITVVIEQSKGRIRAGYSSSGLRGSVSVDFTGRVGQIDCQRLALTPVTLDRLTTLVEGQLRLTARKALDKAQEELAVDPFGFGTKLFQSDPRGWFRAASNWPAAFQTMEIGVHVKARLRGSGLTQSPVLRQR